MIIVQIDQLEVQIVHVSKMFTSGADALAKMELSALKQKNRKGVPISQITTRAQMRRMQQQDDPWQVE